MDTLAAWKDFLQPFLPLLGVIVGAFSAGFGQLYKVRQERRRAIASALSELLEVRHRVVMLHAFMKHIQQLGSLPPASIPHLRNLFDHFVPLDGKLDARFDDAVTLLASIDPVLAFELRSQNLMPHFLNKLRSLATLAGEDLANFEAYESKLIEAVTPKLDEAVSQLAKYHSMKARREVKLVFAMKDKISERLAPLLEAIEPKKAPTA